MDGYEAILLGIQIFFGVVVFFSLLFVVFIPMGKNLRTKPKLPAMSPQQDRLNRLQWGEEKEEREIQVPSQDDLDRSKPSNEKIVQLAKEQPMHTAAQVRKWIQERNKK